MSNDIDGNMSIKILKTVFIFVFLLGFNLDAFYLYHGLDPLGDVKSSGSDARSSDFNTNHFSNVLNYIDSHTNYHHIFNPDSWDLRDAASLQSTGDTRVYFIDRNHTGEHSIGVTVGDDFDLQFGDDVLVFPNVGHTEVWGAARAPSPGDFVDLDHIEAGENMNFFMADDGGGYGGYNTPLAEATLWWADEEQNQPLSSMEHVLAVKIPNTTLMLLAFEVSDPLTNRFGTGRYDFDDILVIVDGAVTPEPETYLILGTFLAFVILIRGKRSRRIPLLITQKSRSKIH